MLFNKRTKTKYPKLIEWYEDYKYVSSLKAILGTEVMCDAIWLLREHAINSNHVDLTEPAEAASRRQAFAQGYLRALSDLEALAEPRKKVNAAAISEEWEHLAND
jgi:hypothetical protein